jgi:23S rRNA (guanosine2251-2'-O)-methyltransferase
MAQGNEREQQEDIIIGRQPVIEALKSGTPIEKILLLFGIKGPAIDKIRHLAKQRGVVVAETNRQKFDEITKDENAQGVLAFVSSKEYSSLEEIVNQAQATDQPPFILILDELEDPHNVGALIRTADAAGVHGVVIAKHHAVSINRTVAKTSAGASAHMPIARVTNIVSAIEELKVHGLWIVGTEMSGDRFYTDVDYRGSIGIVIGNEGKGIRRLVAEKCDFLVKIPMLGKIESLNASVAGALVMFEVVRTRMNKS